MRTKSFQVRRGALRFHRSAQVDVSEVYSQPRVVPVGRKMGSQGGFSLYLTTTDRHGAWGFPVTSRRARALELLKPEEPLLAFVSTMCTHWSSRNNMSLDKRARPATNVTRRRQASLRACLQGMPTCSGTPDDCLSLITRRVQDLGRRLARSSCRRRPWCRGFH